MVDGCATLSVPRQGSASLEAVTSEDSLINLHRGILGQVAWQVLERNTADVGNRE
jgi:hypothetical protein